MKKNNEAPEPANPVFDGRPLRIGVLCSSAGLAAWQVECIKDVQKLDFAEVVVFICQSPPSDRRDSFWSRLASRLASGLFLWRAYERAVVDRKSAASRLGPIPVSLSNVPRLVVEPIAFGKFRQAFDAQSLEAVRKYELDVLLRFGFGILTGGILDAAKFGIWSFHHGDPEFFRGAPPGFWEIHNGCAVTGAILQRLTETLDGGVVLRAGWFKTNLASYPKSLDRILFGASHFVAHALKELRWSPETFVNRKTLQTSGPIYRYPRTRAMLRFFARTFVAKIKNQYLALFRHQQWSVGILNRPVEAVFRDLSGGAKLRVQDVKWLPEPSGGFLADPFWVQIGRECVIIAEELDWKTGLGRISALPLDPTGYNAPKVVIQSAHHLSYPYIFDHGGETYCAPECAGNNGVVLFRLLRDKGHWIEHKKIIDGIPALDPTIFLHEGRWWLFCTDSETGPNDFLYAWFADDPTAEWTPHKSNPLKVDVRSARPAGRPFILDGALLRPAQDCSLTYGGAITFNRIVKLTPEDFSEEFAGQLLPAQNLYSAGLHTITGAADQTIVDGARLRFVPSEFWRAGTKIFRRVSQ